MPPHIINELTFSWTPADAAAAAANRADEETAMEDTLSAVLPTLALACKSLAEKVPQISSNKFTYHTVIYFSSYYFVLVV